MKDTHEQAAARERIWTVRYDRTSADHGAAQNTCMHALCRALHITPLTACLLFNRGLTTADGAGVFLDSRAFVWHDPYLMADMAPAVARVLEALRKGEHIAIFGDYDVDGVTSVTSLYLYLIGLGAHVTCYIPNRAGEGYGMSLPAVDSLIDRGVTLIVTVDTGVTANAEIAHAAERGVDTVVTDHHECHGDLPICRAVVNPHRPDCHYPFKELAGVGVVFKLICACEAARLSLSAPEAFEVMAARLIDLVAIGTIADVMPLEDENRFIVTRGLSMLDHTERPGLIALMDAMSGAHGKTVSASGVSTKKPHRKVNSGMVGFGIAPRINAAGRIAHAMQAVELLLAEDLTEARRMALSLCETNTRRQTAENRIAEEAYAMIEADLRADREAGRKTYVLVLAHDEWQQGIVGIVASRITEKYGLPSILISFEGAVGEAPLGCDIGKGSGRSIKGLNLVEALEDSADLLVRFGGHELAAGLTVCRADIEAFRLRINEYAATRLTEDMTAVRYEAECEVEASELTMRQAEELERFEPFGVGNPTPLFILRGAIVHRVIPLGGGKHTKLMLSRDGCILPAVWFGMSPSNLPVGAEGEADVLFQLNINDYQGVRSLQLIVQDLRPSTAREDAQRQVADRVAAILAGGPLASDEDLCPTREDIGCVFTVLRHSIRLGETSLSEHELLDRINRTPAGVAHPIGPVKLRLIGQILGEMQVAAVREPDTAVFCFEVFFGAEKTSIEASPLYRSLRHRMTGE